MLRPGSKISQQRKTAKWVISLSFALLFCGVACIYAISTMSSARAMPYTSHNGGGGVNAGPNPARLLTPPPPPPPGQTPTPDVSINRPSSGEDETPTDGANSDVTPTPDGSNGDQTPQPEPTMRPVIGGIPTALPTRTAPQQPAQPVVFPGLPSTGSDPRGVALP
jgi:hypothetical protein